MGFNYAAEKKKFETLWARLRREYRAAGMSDAAIQKMHDFDWEVFKQERIYRLHTQDLGIGIFDEPSAEQEDKSALMKKFLESVSRWDDYTTASRYGWIEGIGDQRLVRVLKRLSISEKELLTKYCITIRHTVTSCDLDGKRVLVASDTTKTKSSMRTLPLVPFMRERLLTLKEEQQENRRLCGRSYIKEYYESIETAENSV